MDADYTSYSVKFRKDGTILQNSAQAEQAFIRLIRDRGYISEIRSGKLYFFRMENFGIQYWPTTLVEISEEENAIVFDFQLPAFQALFVAFPKKLKFYIDKEVMPEWSILRID
jgi:hypothetical protein